MRIGMDVSIATCRDEGYMVMDYDVHNFNHNPWETDCRFTMSLPLYIREDLGWNVGQPMMVIDVWLNWNDLIEIYEHNKEGIDSFIGVVSEDESYSAIKTPDEYDLLNLASDIEAYCGLT